jgi:hypothetical protein
MAMTNVGPRYRDAVTELTSAFHPEPMKFRDLDLLDSFDFVGPDRLLNSFYLRCIKTGPRTYNDETGVRHRVGSINATVYHVDGRDW